MKTSKPLAAALLAGTSLLFNGCSALTPKPDPTRFYVLRPVEPPSPTPEAESALRGVLRIGPGRIPAYLDSTPILVDEGANRVRPLPFHQWAEPLSKGLERVLIGNLRASLPRLNTVSSADPAASPADTRLSYDMTRFEGAPGREVVLEVSWTLHSEHAQRNVPTRRFTVPAPDNPSEEIAGYVARLSQAVALWSDAIVKTLP
jgi:uncharacterized protein